MLTSVNQNYYSYNTEDQIEAMVGIMYDGFTLGMNLVSSKISVC